MTWLINRVIDLTPLGSWWSGKGDKADEESLPIDVRIASWITENHLLISIGSFIAAMPKTRLKAGNYRVVVVQAMLFFAVADLFLRGEGTAQQQCETFRQRVETALDDNKKADYEEIKQLYGGAAWQRIAKVCKEMAVDNPFKIESECGWIVKASWSDVESQAQLITEATKAMRDWLKPEVHATVGRRIINTIKLALPYYLARFWN